MSHMHCTSITFDGRSNLQLNFSGSAQNVQTDFEKSCIDRKTIWATLLEQKTGQQIASYHINHGMTVILKTPAASDGDYEQSSDDQFLQNDLRLAQLLYPEQLFETHKNRLFRVDPDGTRIAMTRWSQNDEAAFNLIPAIGLKVDCTDTDERFICYAHVSHQSRDGYIASHMENHGSKKAATRCAIVEASILKLKAKLEKKSAPGIGL